MELTTFNVLDDAAASEWDRLVQEHSDYGFFHCARWGRVICRTYKHQPVYVRFSTGNNGAGATLLPLIEIRSALTGRRAVCLPFSDACAPLTFGDEGLELIMSKVETLCRERRWKYIELRGAGGLRPDSEPVKAFYGHKIDLRGNEDEVFARFSNGTRGAIRQAQKTGIAVEISDCSKAMEEFYQLHLRTRHRHGAPPQPVAFFRNIHDILIKPGLGYIVLARTEGQTVAGAVFLRFGRQATYKFAASDPQFAKSRGNNIVMWEGIRKLRQDGVEVLDLGRTDIGNEGLRRFKTSWGTREEQIGYYRFDIESGTWVSSQRTGSSGSSFLFRRLPLAANRFVGSMLYPHLD